MTRLEKKQMKGYMLPYPVKEGNTTVLSGKPSMYGTILSTLRGKAWGTINEPVLEDKMVEVWMNYWKQDKFVNPKTFIRTVITEYIRQERFDAGKSARGTEYKQECRKRPVIVTVGGTQEIDEYGLAVAGIDGSQDWDFNSGINTDPKNWYKPQGNTNEEE